MSYLSLTRFIDYTDRGLLFKSPIVRSLQFLVLLIFGVFVIAVCIPLAWVTVMSISKAGLWLSVTGFRHNINLLARSFLLASIVGILSVTVSLPASSILAQGKGFLSNLFRAFFIFPLIVPSYVYAYSWELILGGKGISFTGGLIGAGGLSAFVLTITVCTMMYWPIAAAILAAGYRQLNSEIIAQASLEGSPFQIFRYVTLPLLRPFILTAFLCSSLLSLGDYSIPHLFGADTYATEALAEYQANINAARLAGFGFPALLAGAIAFIALFIQLQSSGKCEYVGNRDYKTLTFSKATLLRYAFMVALCVVTILLPIFSLAKDITTLSDFKSVVCDYAEEITASGIISFFSTLAILMIALGTMELFSGVFAGKKAWLGQLIQRILISICLGGTILPAAVIGAGLIGIYNRGGIFGYLYNSSWIVVLGNVVKFASLGFLVVYIVRRNLGKHIIEAAFVDGANLWQRFSRIILPLSIVPLSILACLIFFLCFSELPLVSILLPAGLANFPMTLMNHMHYGRTESVSSICLVMVVAVLFLLALWVTINRHLNPKSFNRTV